MRLQERVDIDWAEISATALRPTLDKIRMVHQAALRVAQYAGIDEVEQPTLPDADKIDRQEGEGGLSSIAYQRPALNGLRRFVKSIAPEARISIVKGGALGKEYIRVSDEADEPEWVIADHDTSGNALFVWRRDRSPVDPDTAFATTKRTAEKIHRCVRIIHPAHMDQLPDEDIDAFYQGPVLDALTVAE